jgi:transposase-like protein
MGPAHRRSATELALELGIRVNILHKWRMAWWCQGVGKCSSTRHNVIDKPSRSAGLKENANGSVDA